MTPAASRESDRPPSTAPPQPPPQRRRRRYLRWIEHVLATAAGLWLLLLVSPLPRWLYTRFDAQGELRPAKYIICLGGDPARIIEATRLLDEGYGEELIVSNNPEAAPFMRQFAAEWRGRTDRILIDDGSWRTADHPASIRRTCGVDPTNDVCIVVTSFTHMLRAKACFEKAGYRHIIMREPRWDRQFRVPGGGVKANYWIMPELFYECAALAEYRLRGWI
jgi:uncharacterized SAM-binding protein YcdF (DUF218 family)